MTKKYYLKIKQGSDKYISPWRISKVIDDLAIEYYKKYLLNIIVDRIPILNENEDLIIFEDSFDLYNKYSNLKKFSFRKSEDVLDIYHLGNPMSLKPNLKVKKISLIFEMHRSLYTKLNSIKIIMDKDKLFEYIEPNFNYNEELDLSLLEKYLIELLSSPEKEYIKNECDEIIRKFKKKLSNYLEHALEFNLINDFEDEQELKDYLDKSKNHNLYRENFENFENIFVKLGRPIVGVMDIEKGTLEILAKDFIREDLQNQNESKFEMVELSKNSPTAMAFIVGVMVIPWLSNLVITNLETKKIKQERKIEKPEVATNPELLKLNEVIQGFEDLHEKIDDIGDKVISIEDYKMQKAIRKMNSKIVENTKDTLHKNDFLNENIELSPVEAPEEDEE